MLKVLSIGPSMGYTAALGRLVMIQSDIKTFLTYDYGEAKDLIKTFLTLISATLVLSLTFSEKVIGLNQASTITKRLLLAAWTLFILALVFAGIAMCSIAAAAGKKLYPGGIPFLNFAAYQLELACWVLVLVSGATYVAGLISLTIATARSMFGEPKAPGRSPS